MIDPTETFRIEAAEHVDVLEQTFMELETDRKNSDLIARAFRSMHTIKGSAGMVGYDHLSYFTHHLESLLDAARNGQMVLNVECTDALLKANDHIRDLLRRASPSPEDMAVSERLLECFRALFPLKQDSASGPDATASRETTTTPGLYRIAIQPDADAFIHGFDLIPLWRELESLGVCHIATYLNTGDYGDTPDVQACHLKSTVLLKTDASKAAIDDVFMFVIDDWDIQIQHLDEDEAFRIGDLLVQQGVITREEVDRLLENTPKAGELLTREGAVQPEHIERALAEQAYLKQQAPKQTEQSLRVTQSKLDALMDQVGELVILQASLDQLALETEDERIEGLSEELDRLANNLRDITFEIRMLPIGTSFSKFRRLVRDLGKDLGKDVALVTEGGDTELDKVVLDKLGDPLVHILRNAMDHGIETPEVRLAQDKPEQGTIRLLAWHSQGQIRIEISDDGKGLDRERILQKAIDKGLVQPSASLSDQEVFQLIFEPGFSTAQTVSDVSGRGVGMDVVRSSIESLQGKVSLSSVNQKGTTLHIQLPMTLSIIDGLMVAVDGQHYIIPLSLVEECIETQNRGGNGEPDLLNHRSNLLPRVSLRDTFQLSPDKPRIEQTVIVKAADMVLGITVDEVIGNHQTVIRNMGRLYRDIRGVMGATILGDGGIAMILDIAALAEDCGAAKDKQTKRLKS